MTNVAKIVLIIRDGDYCDGCHRDLDHAVDDIVSVFAQTYWDRLGEQLPSVIKWWTFEHSLCTQSALMLICSLLPCVADRVLRPERDNDVGEGADAFRIKIAKWVRCLR